MKLKPLRFVKMGEGAYAAYVMDGLVHYYVDKEGDRWRCASSPGSLMPVLQHHDTKARAINYCRRHWDRLVNDLFTTDQEDQGHVTQKT